MNSENSSTGGAEELAAEQSGKTPDDLIAAQERLEQRLVRPEGEALRTPVAAETHTPAYEMHRYYARRSHSVFRRLLQHYSRPGQMVLDPFCGGGVTVVEGLRLRRRVVGVDYNPMATLVTRMSVTPAPVSEFNAVFAQLAARVGDVIMGMCRTDCPECGSLKAFAEWYEWSTRVRCPHCSKAVTLAEATKPRGSSEYECPHCRTGFVRTGLTRLQEIMTRVKWKCPECKRVGQKRPDKKDLRLARSFDKEFAAIVAREGLWYPTDEFPDCDRRRDDGLDEKGIKLFSDFYTRRNLIALSRLFQAIHEVVPPDSAELWFLTFTSALWRCTRNAYVKTDQRLVNHGHTYWVPDVYGEINVWDYFVKRRVAKVRKGLQYADAEINGFATPAESFAELAEGTACLLLLCRSSDDLPMPSGSVDVVITDPPFGSNVQYSELSNLWWIWRGQGLIENTKEAVETRNTGFPSAKDSRHYEEMLYRVFRECHRVLKPDGWMVLTFHNREIGVWMTLHRAANRAGFQLPTAEEDLTRGMLYQPPISVYTTTLHQQATGAMLGDFVLSFKRRDKPVLVGDELEGLDREEQGLLRERVQHLIEFHGGADLNTLMTGLLPFLQERGLLHRLARFDFEAFLAEHFSKRQGKWYTTEMAEGLQQRGRPMSELIPAEMLVQQIVLSLLHEKKIVTLDEILTAVYQMLVNSQRPNAEAVHNVLARLCVEAPLPGHGNRKGFALNTGEQSRGKVKTKAVAVQPSLYGGDDVVLGSLTHNELIARLLQRAHHLRYSCHVGETEQGKSRDLAEASIPMASNVELGLPLRAFNIIKEIDLLILKDRAIQAAFEVATTIGTANKAVNDRYRNLFAALNPGFQLRCYLVVKDQDYGRASQILYTPANVQDGVSTRVHIVKTSSLTPRHIDELIDPARGL